MGGGGLGPTGIGVEVAEPEGGGLRGAWIAIVYTVMLVRLSDVTLIFRREEPGGIGTDWLIWLFFAVPELADMDAPESVLTASSVPVPTADATVTV